MNTPIISIVMPVYNGDKYIRECIDSILSQTYIDFELIIINDGSTDTTQKIIESYKDERILLINNHHDFIDSLNIGISKAQGQYIARMDADDIMFPHRLQKHVKFMKEHQEIDVCGGAMKLFGAVDNESHPSTDPLLLKLNFLHANQISHPTVMMKTCLRELFPKKDNIFQMYQKGYDCAEDYKLWIDLIQKGCNITNISEILIKYRISESQVTRKNQSTMINSSLRIQAEYIENIMDQITKINENLFDFFNSIIDAVNMRKNNFGDLKSAIYPLYKEFLTLELI